MGDSVFESSSSEGLSQYRKVGTQLVGLWRQYTAASAALGHLLRDYNVTLRQEQRVELVELLQRKQKAAAAALKQQQQQQRGRGSRARAMLPLWSGEKASLNEIKEQIKRLDEKMGSIPDYRQTEKNAFLVRLGTSPVNVSKALTAPFSSLFHTALSSYKTHLHDLKKKYDALFSTLEQIKYAAAAAHERREFIGKTAELESLFDPDAPTTLKFPKTQ
ncbi:hypothetical protein, conserved [Eimeria maxima]|uniref:Uncharacterized protein n=1 Tax=Eimeria maxima TaxID=5804 RepID=U6M6A8_EIMMA|nr:hypothetical protein, conserved [Eimeria maxima]CDJ59767.1 hypothetical protein, conserved [Eimeria maxima]